ncbi:MAG TPA: hypothetical protein VN541_08740, partial [Tepidisphaeraceae bacterium]|nr:hypothetical protein [Tepidisphaeraceae bacterium]
VTPVTPEAPPSDASASPTTQPTTQPAEAQRYELRRMRSQADLGAVARASVASPATTQPATQPGLAGQSPATQPTDLAMDVVILLQPTPPATAAAAPATQPAASAPSQPANSPATQPGQ